MKTILAGLLLSLMATGAWARCEEDTIETVSQDGDLIVLMSGQSYDVTGGDEATSSTWTEGDTVLICGDDTMIDKDQNGEKVEVMPH